MRLINLSCPLTEFLIILNILIFIYTLFYPQVVEQYAISAERVMQGNFSVLITHMFLHAGFWHIFWNMIGLLLFGYYLEKEFGSMVLLFVYLFSGVLAGLLFCFFSYIYYHDPTRLAVGASGAIFGLMGFLTLIRPFALTILPFLIPMPIALASVLYTAVAILIFTYGSTTMVAHEAHLAGLFAGAFLAMLFEPQRALVGLAIVIAIALMLILLVIFVL